MDRAIYISGEDICLAEYLPEDNPDNYNDWLDPDTQRGYNFIRTESYEEFVNSKRAQRFVSSIMLNGSLIGWIGLSPEGSPPDLAIRIFKPYRGKGYGTAAFKLAIRYCFETLKLEKIYAGCYPGNSVSEKMLTNCGFIRNPEGDMNEKHYLTGENIVQHDFILKNKEVIDLEGGNSRADEADRARFP